MNKALQLGAHAQLTAGSSSGGWRSMDSAPRDGTLVGLKNTYGVAPWYCVARWTDEAIAIGENGERHPFKMSEPSWQKPEGGGPCGEQWLHWRPYDGSPEAYVDPTGGMQNDMAYWRGAVASRYGLPLDHFEAMAERNAKSSPPPPQPKAPWWKRVFG